MMEIKKEVPGNFPPGSLVVRPPSFHCRGHEFHEPLGWGTMILQPVRLPPKKRLAKMKQPFRTSLDEGFRIGKVESHHRS